MENENRASQVAGPSSSPDEKVRSARDSNSLEQAQRRIRTSLMTAEQVEHRLFEAHLFDVQSSPAHTTIGIVTGTSARSGSQFSGTGATDGQQSVPLDSVTHTRGVIFFGEGPTIARYNSERGAFEEGMYFDLESEPGPCECDKPEVVDTITVNLDEKDDNGKPTGRKRKKVYKIFRCVMADGRICYYIQIQPPGTKAQKNGNPGHERSGRGKRVRIGFIPIVKFFKTGEITLPNGKTIPLNFAGRFLIIEVPDCTEDVYVIQIYWLTHTFTFCDGTVSEPVREPKEGWKVDGEIPYGATLPGGKGVGGIIDTPGFEDTSGGDPHGGRKKTKAEGGEPQDLESDHLVQHFITYVYCGNTLLGYHTWDNDITMHYACPGKPLHDPPVEVKKQGGPLGDGQWKDWDKASEGDKANAEGAAKSAGLPPPTTPPPFKK